MVSQRPRRSPYAFRLSAEPAADARRALSFLIQLGELLLRSGAGSADVEASLIACAAALGLPDAEASITYTEVHVSVSSGTGAPLNDLRIVRVRSADHNRLVALHQLVLRLTDGEIGAEDAYGEIQDIARARKRYPRWGVTGAWALLAAAVAVQLGGGWLLAVVTFVTTVGIDRLGRRLAYRNVPDFYLNFVGGAIVTAVAVLLTAAGIPVHPPLVVAGGVVLLLPGLAMLATVQDTLTGFMVTAAGRAMEVLILAAGITGGVALSLVVARQIGISMPVQPPLSFTLSGLPGRFVSAGVVATTMAVGLYAPVRLLPPAFVLGGAGYAAFLGLDHVLVSPALSRGVVAVAIGVCSQSFALRRRVPALVVVLPAIVPMLPGLTIYAAMLELTQGDSFSGISGLLLAATESLALAAGVILGQYVGQPLSAELSRFDRRRTRRWPNV